MNDDRATKIAQAAANPVTQFLWAMAELYPVTRRYWPIPPVPLILRGNELYKASRGDIVTVLTAGGVNAGDACDILSDFDKAVSGELDFHATYDQMKSEVDADIPAAFYKQHIFDFFLIVDGVYRTRLRMWDRYDKEVKNPATATVESRRAFLSEKYVSINEASAFLWLIHSRRVEASDFDGLTPDEVIIGVNRILSFVALGDYYMYVAFAKYGLSATDGELNDIFQPRTSADIKTTPLEWSLTQAKKIADDARVILRAKEAATATSQRPSRGTKQSDADILSDKRPAILYSDFPKATAKLIEVVGANEKRVVEAKRPLRQYLFEWTEKHKADGLAAESDLIVNKILFGLCQMLDPYRRRELNCRVVDKDFAYKISLSKFAEIVGYPDANQDTKNQLYSHLRALNDLVIVAEKVHRTQSGKESKSVVYVRPVDLRSYDKTRGEMDLRLATELVTGEGKAITTRGVVNWLTQYEKKSLTRTRFISQIITKFNKSRKDMLNEVYGYDDALKPIEKKERIRRERIANILKDCDELRQRLDGAKTDAEMLSRCSAYYAELDAVHKQVDVKTTVVESDDNDTRLAKNRRRKSFVKNSKSAKDCETALKDLAKIVEERKAVKAKITNHRGDNMKELDRMFDDLERARIIKITRRPDPKMKWDEGSYKWKFGIKGHDEVDEQERPAEIYAK